jgi:hypothetical protein
MIVFVFKTDSGVRLNYSGKHDESSTFLGCGRTKSELWSLVRLYMSNDEFEKAYRELLPEKISGNWQSNPFERMRKQSFLKRRERQ